MDKYGLLHRVKMSKKIHMDKRIKQFKSFGCGVYHTAFTFL